MKRLDYKKISYKDDELIEFLDLILKQGNNLDFVPKKIRYFVRTKLEDFYIIHTPLLILGSNPFLNLLLLLKVVNNGIDTLIHMPEYQDQWCYEVMRNPIVTDIFNKSFNIEKNNNFFYNFSRQIKSLIDDKAVSLGLIYSDNSALVRNSIKLLDKHVFWVRDKKYIEHIDFCNQNKNSALYVKMFEDFKSVFEEFEVSNHIYDERSNNKHVYVIADKIISTSFLPYIELKNVDSVFSLGSQNSYLEQLEDINELLKLNVKDLSKIIFSEELNVWLSENFKK